MLKWQYKQDISETEAESEVIRSCETCGEKLVSVCTSVGEKFYHLDCVLCSICGVKIDDKFFLENGEILCENDYDKVAHPFIMSIGPSIFLLTLSYSFLYC